MPARRRAVAAFVSIAICAALHVATWKPLAVQAIPLLVDPGGITTNAGSVGVGPAINLGQVPYAVAVAGTHLLVGDVANPVLRDVNIAGGQETVRAGNDSYGYSGNGGAATSAMIFGATAIAFCGTDTYFADDFNYVIRKIDGSGIITTIAGNGKPGFSGDGGPGTSAQLSRVLGLACRSGGGLYISDSDNGRVRILDASGTIYTWWYGFGFPTGIVETGGQDLVDVSDTGSNTVWALSDSSAASVAGTGVAGSSGDGGPATSARLNGPRGLAYDAAFTRLFIADTNNNKVRMVTGFFPATITTLAGTGVAGFNGDSASAADTALLDHPTDLSIVPNTTIGNMDIIFVADNGNFRVRRIDNALGNGVQIFTVAGNGTPSLSGDGGQATSAQLGNPYAVAFDAAGNEYIADNQNDVIRKITTSGVISTFAGTGVVGYTGDGGPPGSATLNDPRGVAVNSSGDVFISDAGNLVVRKVDHLTGQIHTWAAGLNFPTALAVDGSDNVYIADTGYNRVLKVAANQTLVAVYGSPLTLAGYGGDGGPATDALFNAPQGLAVDASGNLVIADTLNHRARLVASGTGIITTIAGNGQPGLAGDLHPATLARLASPHGLAFDPAGNLFIADTDNERIRAIDTHGIIRSVVGVCGIVAAFSGDGGPADLAHINTPFGLATNAVGNLFIAEINSNRVRIASIPQGTRGDSCPGPVGSPGARGVTAGSGGSPGTRVPQNGPTSRIPMPLNLPAGTMVPARPTHVLPSRHSTRVTAPSRQAAGAARPSNVQAVPEVVGAVKPAMAVRPTNSGEPISPWYAFLLLPFALLVVALVIQWRRQRE